MSHKARMAAIFNEWMRRYTENPEQFGHEWQEVNKFLSEKAAGTEPTYGENCVAYFEQIAKELFPTEV